MGYNDSQLTPTDMPKHGFAGVECPVKGIIKLLLTMGQEPRQATQMLSFVVPIEDLDICENDEKRGKPVKKLIPVPLAPEDPEKVTSNRPGIDPELITHKLNVNPNRKTVNQKRRSFAPERQEAIKNEVENLLEAGFIEEIQFPERLANPVMVKKANGKWRMCVNFTDLNDVCLKDCFPLPRIDTLIDVTDGHEMLSFMDAFSGYNQIKMDKDDRILD
ncbi:hypothetical protein AgCh_027373 [Apium graveolens]